MTEGFRLGTRWRLGVRRLRGWRRGLDFALARRFGLATREDRLFFLLIPLVGLLAGVLGLLITQLIALFQTALWGSGEEILERARNAPAWLRVVAPAIGGGIVGLLVWRARAAVGGHGTSHLLEAVALRGGRISAKPVLLSAAAGVATVGSGGSLGREGPAIGLSSMLASWLGERAKLPAHRLKVLVGCGAAAGMAAIYNTPIGGALFAMEVILGNFALDIFGPIVIASVLSTFVARSFRGAAPIYAAPGYTLVSGWELLAYFGLGIVAAVVSLLFVHALRWVANSFARMAWLPLALRPVLGMTLVGVLGLYVPYVYGNGFDTITLALHEKLPLVLLLTLPAAKLLATALTAGSGGSGGLFTPSLFLGALVGGAYGWGVHALWPDLTGPYGAYAAVGMAAIAAGTSHAPISAILILFEFTGNYDLILPLMLAAISSSLIARRLSRQSIYTDSLARRGVDLTMRMEEAVLAGLSVRDLMRQDGETLRLDDPYRQVVDRFLNTRRQRLFVVDEENRLRGAVSLHDIKHTLAKPEQPATARDLMVPVPRALRETDRLHRAAEAFAQQDFERLPVVGEAGRYSGMLAKRDLLAVYAQEVLGRPALLATFISASDGGASRNYVELPPDFSVRRVELPARLAGRTLAEARLPQSTGTRVLEILRRTGNGGEERVIPGAATRLEAGDALLLLGPTAAIAALERGEMRQSEADVAAGID
jgi:CIC family chloride channel protein